MKSDSRNLISEGRDFQEDSQFRHEASGQEEENRCSGQETVEEGLVLHQTGHEWMTLWQRRERETFIYPLAEEGEREVNPKVSAYIYELDCGYVMLAKLHAC